MPDGSGHCPLLLAALGWPGAEVAPGVCVGVRPGSAATTLLAAAEGGRLMGRGRRRAPAPAPALPLLLFLFLLDPVSAFSCGVCNAFAVSPAAVDPSARTSMKNAASCDKWCELQESVSHRVFERKWRPRAPSRGYVCPSAPCQLWPVAGGGYAGGARVGCCVCLGFSPGVCE